MEAFRQLYSDRNGTAHIVNYFRPTKPLNGRKVYKSYGEKGLLCMFCLMKRAHVAVPGQDNWANYTIGRQS